MAKKKKMNLPQNRNRLTGKEFNRLVVVMGEQSLNKLLWVLLDTLGD